MNIVSNVLGWIDRNVERVLMITAYGTMALIIVWAVIDRFIFKQQAPWSSTIPIYLFIWVTYLGASYNVRLRSHLAFTEFRSKFPYTIQYFCVLLDHILWIGFASMVIYHSINLVALLRDNYAIVPGTDDVMQWWFYCALPVGWSLLIIRCLQNIVQDVRRYGRKEPFILHATIGAD